MQVKYDVRFPVRGRLAPVGSGDELFIPIHFLEGRDESGVKLVIQNAFHGVHFYHRFERCLRSNHVFMTILQTYAQTMP